MSKDQIPELTQYLNHMNIKRIKSQILAKNGHLPYHATLQDSMSIITDQDHFPYTRYYRGIAHSSQPVIMEREAGWRNINNQCYQSPCCLDENIVNSLKVKCIQAYR